MASEATNFLDEGVEAYHKLARVARGLEVDKKVLADKLAEAEVKAKEAEKGRAAALARAVKATAEVEELKSRQADAAASQGEVLRAFAERLFMCGSFSSLASDLAAVLNSRVVASTLDAVAADYPDLDKAKYGYEVVSDKALLRAYAEALAGGMKAFPVVESLASSSIPLTAEAVRTCEVDKDACIEGVIAGLGNEDEEEAEDEEEVDGKGGAEAEKDAEVGGPPLEPGKEKEQELPEAGLTSSSHHAFDLTTWTAQVHKLSRALEAKEAEVLHVKGLLGHAQDEAEVRSAAARVKYDELQARFTELEEKLEISKEDAERIAEEHAEYEAVIHRGGGMTISEVEERVKELLSRCRSYRRQYGTTSWQFQEQLDELKRMGGLYKIIVDRYPRLQVLLSSDAEPSSVAGASTSSNPRSSTRIVNRHSTEFYERERQLRAGRGRARSNQGSRGRGLTWGRGRGRGRVNIDNILSGDFVGTWLNFSHRPPGSSSG